MTPLIGAIRSNADMTVFILDNETVAMTGGQQSMAAGHQLIDIVKGFGLPEEHLHIIEPLPKTHEHDVDVIKKAIGHRGLDVIIAQRECIHNRRKMVAKPEEQKSPQQASCTACGQ
jgi:indolepyruvate ferredoxin oxidoreductase alpha subunit